MRKRAPVWRPRIGPWEYAAKRHEPCAGCDRGIRIGQSITVRDGKRIHIECREAKG